MPITKTRNDGKPEKGTGNHKNDEMSFRACEESAFFSSLQGLRTWRVRSEGNAGPPGSPYLEAGVWLSMRVYYG